VESGEGFILASASPRRIELLESAGLSFDIEESSIAEDEYTGGDPGEYALGQAENKARAVAERRPGRWVLAADTVVVAESGVLGKPRTGKEAEGMLGELSGRVHTVVTGFTILRHGEDSAVFKSVASEVLFRRLSKEEIAGYVATSEPFDKAGAYAIQGRAALFIKEVRGSYTNVVGLPLAEVVEELIKLGIARPFMDIRA
jgi:septum formation protein